jgi:hypothetical protein
MEHAAEAPDEARPHGRLVRIADDVGPKLFVTLVAAGVSALLIPWITTNWQDHKQQLELRTTIATDMSRAYTSVVVTGRFVTGGLIYSGSASAAENTAATQKAWTDAMHAWLVDSGTIAAQLTGRYGSDGIASDWRDYAAAVTRYLRIGSQVTAADRTLLLAQEQAYVRDASIRWDALRRIRGFKRDRSFLDAHAQLGAWLVGRGDALVEEELGLSPRV